MGKVEEVKKLTHSAASCWENALRGESHPLFRTHTFHTTSSSGPVSQSAAPHGGSDPRSHATADRSPNQQWPLKCL